MAVRFEAAGSAPVGHLARPAEITGAPYTRIAWFKFDDDEVPGDSVLWNLESEDASQYDNPETIGSNAVRIYSQSGNTDSSTNVWSDATWHQFAFVRSGNTRTLYRLDVNGVVALATRSAADPLTIAEENLLGYATEVYSRGRAVEHEKCWDAALTVDELAREAQQFAPVRTTNLQGWSKLKVHTDLSDEVGGSWTAVGVTPSTVAGPTGIVEEWTGARVASSATTAATTSSGGLSCNLPSGITAGDLLMAFAANDTSVSWSAGGDWSKIDDGANGTAVQGACWAKIAAGSDTLTITGEANDIAVVTVRIPAAEHGVTDVTTDITLGTAATGTNSAPDGPNCNPGTSAKRLWLTYFAADDDDNATLWWPVEAAPISQTKSAASTSSCMVGVAYRWLEASSYNPSAFLMAASEEWRAQTFAIPPASGGRTGTLAATESGADTAALAGDVLIDGSLAATESGGDTAALAGDVLIAGTFAATESGADVAAIQGTAQQVSTGSLAATESGSDTASIAGVVLVSGSLAATEAANDSAAMSGVVLITGTLDATESGQDTAAISSAPPVTTAYPGPAGKSRGKRRRVVIRERVYEVSERDIPALIEAELLDRAPPVTAEVVAGPKPPRKRRKSATQPVKTVEQVREVVQQIKARIEPDNAWLLQALETVAFRVLERLQDEEDSLMLLLAA